MWVVSKAKLATNVTAKDWTGEILAILKRNIVAHAKISTPTKIEKSATLSITKIHAALAPIIILGDINEIQQQIIFLSTRL
ncbi:MAG: hypothetical protein HYU27_08255 [Acidobacteria bacterium]|nr:hypothetical protein [Acidobacteriota bacterium]